MYTLPLHDALPIYIRRGYKRLQAVGVAGILQNSFVPEPGQQFLMCEWNGSSNIAARIVIMRAAFRRPGLVALPVIRIENIVPDVYIALTVVRRSSRFTDRVDDDRTARSVRSKVGCLHAYFLHHVGVEDGD